MNEGRRKDEIRGGEGRMRSEEGMKGTGEEIGEGI
jgi:hypothetical protein